jgi:hypothetical protein
MGGGPDAHKNHTKGDNKMAGDWIKVEENMPEKPEVWEIAEILQIEPDAVAGKLIRVWAWASRNCNADGVTNVTVRALLDRCAGVTGFAKAMEKAGWLVVENGNLTFPNFERHNGTTAKSRASVSNRVKRFRNGASVTKALPEKRREEVIERDREPVSLKTAISYGNQIGADEETVTQWHNLRSRDGWEISKQNGSKMPVTKQNWMQDLATAKSWRKQPKQTNGHKKPQQFAGMQEDIPLV